MLSAQVLTETFSHRHNLLFFIYFICKSISYLCIGSSHKEINTCIWEDLFLSLGCPLPSHNEKNMTAAQSPEQSSAEKPPQYTQHQVNMALSSRNVSVKNNSVLNFCLLITTIVLFILICFISLLNHCYCEMSS